MTTPPPSTPSRDVVLAGSGAPFAAPLADFLSARGHAVRTLVTDAPETVAPAYAVHHAGVDDHPRDTLAAAVEHADAVVLVGGLGPVASIVSDSRTLDTVLGAIGPAAVLVHTSSLAVLGAPGPDVTVDETTTPDTPAQAQPQRVAEIRTLAADWLRTVVVRPGLVYRDGGGELLHAAVDHARQQGISRFFGDPDDRLPTVHLDDVLDLYARVIEDASAHGIFHAASDDIGSRELAELVAHLAGVASVGPWTPAALAELGVPFGPPRVDLRLWTSRAVEELGWRPAAPSLVRAWSVPTR